MSGQPPPFERRVYELTFDDDHAFRGLVVTCRAPSMRRLLALEEKAPALLAAVLAAGGDEPALPGNAGELVRDSYQMLAEQIVSWNLTENGEPVPVSFDSLMDQDSAMVAAILEEFQKKVMRAASVPPPLRNGSGTTPASPGPRQIPMTPVKTESHGN